MTKEQEFRKQTEEAKFEAFSLMCKKVLDLEQENAELKEELKDANVKVVHLACNQNKDLKYKLTKAKELLQHFISMDLFQIAENDQDYNAIEQAEQFLEKVK